MKTKLVLIFFGIFSLLGTSAQLVKPTIVKHSFEESFNTMTAYLEVDSNTSLSFWENSWITRPGETVRVFEEFLEKNSPKFTVIVPPILEPEATYQYEMNTSNAGGSDYLFDLFTTKALPTGFQKLSEKSWSVHFTRNALSVTGLQATRVIVFNSSAQEVFSGNISGGNVSFPQEMRAGMYVVMFDIPGEARIMKKFIVM